MRIQAARRTPHPGVPSTSWAKPLRGGASDSRERERARTPAGICAKKIRVFRLPAEILASTWRT